MNLIMWLRLREIWLQKRCQEVLLCVPLDSNLIRHSVWLHWGLAFFLWLYLREVQSVDDALAELVLLNFSSISSFNARYVSVCLTTLWLWVELAFNQVAETFVLQSLRDVPTIYWRTTVYFLDRFAFRWIKYCSFVSHLRKLISTSGYDGQLKRIRHVIASNWRIVPPVGGLLTPVAKLAISKRVWPIRVENLWPVRRILFVNRRFILRCRACENHQLRRSCVRNMSSTMSTSGSFSASIVVFIDAWRCNSPISHMLRWGHCSDIEFTVRRSSKGW